MARLSLINFLKYVKGDSNSRCVYEGEEVLNAGHVILCGVTLRNEKIIKLFALVLQTSALSSNPHEVKGDLIISENNNVLIDHMVCSCIAGNSGKCKHISAVLILCTRSKIDDLELISQTDIKCVWANQKENTKEKYKAVPIDAMPCFSQSMDETLIIDDENAETILQIFIKNLPASASALHNAGRRPESNNECLLEEFKINEENVHNINILLNNACQSLIMFELYSLTINLNECCKKLYESLFNGDPDDICNKTFNQRSVWTKERQFRITGSKIYEIYTYSKNEWEKKSNHYFWPKSFTNKYVKHGLDQEDNAITCFQNQTNMEVRKFGLIISNSNKWLGYSPDGVIFQDKYPTALLEIKCPYAGSTENIDNVLKTLNYLTIENGIYTLKTKHKYYGQIQLGMAILNLKICYFCIYCSFDKSIKIMEIPFDYNFSKTMLINVKQKFFNDMFQFVCKQNTK